MGGTCLNYGCIPTKALISSVNVLEKIKNADSFGLQVGEVRVSLEKIRQRKNEVIRTLGSGIKHLINKYHIEYIEGKAEVKNSKTILVKNESINAIIKFKKLIIVTGSKPVILPIEGADKEDVLTSQDLLELTEIPSSITIIGGGIIGMEFAFIYSALGSKVNVVEYLPQVLNTVDQDVVDIVRRSALEKGIKLYEGAEASSIKSAVDGSKVIEIIQNNQTEYITSAKIVMAVGRKANLESLDLVKLGVELNEKHKGIMVDELCGQVIPIFTP